MRKLPLLLCLVFAAVSQASTRIGLNDDWRFRTDPNQEGRKLGWPQSMPAGTEAVSVPHTWNIGARDDYEGVAWYFKRIAIPKALLGQHLEIHFGATFYKARLWLNGTELGEHEGGHTEYFFDIGPQARETNYLAVEIDNRPGLATIPGWAMRLAPGIWYDWWHYGGIVRDVWIAVSEDVLVRRQQIRSTVASGAAEISDRVFLENAGAQPRHVRLTASAVAPDGSVAAASEPREIDLAPGKNEVPVALHVAAPKLWSIDHSNVYQMRVEVTEAAGRPLDTQADTFGIRTIELRDRHLLINGERVRLSGITRHEESPWEGLAETRGTILHDWRDMKSLDVTITRPVHYPQNPAILDFADRNGILLVPEIPIWQMTGKQMSDPKLIALARQMMREMIEQDGNHPSIFGWSVCNESETSTPGGRAYFRQMKALIREIDPDRFVTFADEDLPGIEKAEDDAASDADFIMMNEYFGTWSGPSTLLPATLDKVDRLFPNKAVLISEFGAPGLFEKNSREGDRLRVQIIRSQLAEFGKRDWIMGALLWCYQDYKSHRNLWPGYTEGYVDHGVVDENYQRRPSYYVWKDLNAPARIEAAFVGGSYFPPSRFNATVAMRPDTELPSYPLHDYCLRWEVRDQRGTLVASGEREFPDLAAPATIAGAWQPKDTMTALTLELTLTRPTGFVAAEKRVQWLLVRPGGENERDLQPDHLPY
jgi:beta-glucuronidase